MSNHQHILYIEYREIMKISKIVHLNDDKSNLPMQDLLVRLVLKQLAA